MATAQPENAGRILAANVTRIVAELGDEAESRAYRVSNELANATAYVLRGQRSGRLYNVPGTGRMKYNKKNHTATISYVKYRASAPGESPAVRTGGFRAGWTRRNFVDPHSGPDRTIHALAENDQRVGQYLLGGLLEDGTDRMKPRPYKQKVIDMAMPRAMRIWREPYRR